MKYNEVTIYAGRADIDEITGILLVHGNLGAMLLRDETKCFAFLAGHESFAAAEGAIGIVQNANKARKEPLRVILNGLGKDAAQIISRINGFTYVQTQFDYATGELKEVQRIAYSDGERAEVNCYGADDVREGVAIMALLGSVMLLINDAVPDFYRDSLINIRNKTGCGAGISPELQTEITGRILSYTAGSEEKCTMIIKTDKGPRVQAVIYGDPAGFGSSVGKTVRAAGKMYLPGKSRNPGGFDQALYLKSKKVGTVMRLLQHHLHLLL